MGVHRNRLSATQVDKGIKQTCGESLPSLGALQAGAGDTSYDLHLFVGIASVTAPPGTSELGNEERFDRGGGLLSFLRVSGFYFCLDGQVLCDRHIPCRAWFGGLLLTLLIWVRAGRLKGVKANKTIKYLPLYNHPPLWHWLPHEWAIISASNWLKIDIAH